jgi:energy-coupling factor transporter ATP-binding protein EcfA2
MKTNGQQVLVVGLPETGKSSFIQALDEALKHPAGPDALRSDGLAHDRSYIQSGKPDFLAGEEHDRTDRQIEDTSVELWFQHPPTGKRGRLYLPDKKGEVFLDQWTNRQWEKEYRENLRDVVGALVFVHADQRSRNDERLGVLAAKAPKTETERPWEMHEASAQVQLVDVLQFIAEQGDGPRPLRVAVLISAWDSVGKPGDLRPKEPATFLEREWALVAQYLRANPESFILSVFGVSAFGGTPGSLGDLAKLAAHKRSRLIEGTKISNDLTLPLRWLLELA